MTTHACSCQSDEKTIREAGARFKAAAAHITCAQTEAFRLYAQAVMTMMAAGVPPTDMARWDLIMLTHNEEMLTALVEGTEPLREERKL